MLTPRLNMRAFRPADSNYPFDRIETKATLWAQCLDAQQLTATPPSRETTFRMPPDVNLIEISDISGKPWAPSRKDDHGIAKKPMRGNEEYTSQFTSRSRSKEESSEEAKCTKRTFKPNLLVFSTVNRKTSGKKFTPPTKAP